VLWAGGRLQFVVGAMWAVAPAQLAAMLLYHGERPLEFEAIGASIAWLVGPTRFAHSFGSFNRESPYGPIIITMFSLLNIVSSLALSFSFVQRRVLLP
jgi:hypothetical protein